MRGAINRLVKEPFLAVVLSILCTAPLAGWYASGTVLFAAERYVTASAALSLVSGGAGIAISTSKTSNWLEGIPSSPWAFPRR